MNEDLLTNILVLSLVLGIGAYEIAKPGCPDECGGIKIPFPFGIGPGCSFMSNYSSNFTIFDGTYEIKCNHSTNPPVPLLMDNTVNWEVLSINVEDHSISVSSGVAYDCEDTGESVPSTSPNNTYTLLGSEYSEERPFHIINAKNKFVTIGCDTNASLFGASDLIDEASACTTSCAYADSRVDGCNSDQGCCEASVFRNMSSPSVHVGSLSNDTVDSAYTSCRYAFLTEVGSYNFSATSLTVTAIDCYKMRVPVLYNWYMINLDGTMNCSEVANRTKMIVCGSNTQFECEFSEDYFYGGYGYCQCLEGYTGNPYLPRGCQDINECLEERLNDCQGREFCVNKDGGYDCKCPDGQLGHGTTASPCIPIPSAPGAGKLILGLSTGMGSMIGFVILYGLYKLFKRRKEMIERQQNFKRNGGLLLQQEEISTNDGGINRTKIFHQAELEKATDNFNENRVLGCGGQGTVYKGMLTDGTIVAVKKSKRVNESQLAQFINEVVILSKINHRNVVKLFGCCLETGVPLLVYEFVPNGTLYQHIHHPNEDFQLTWKIRFQIAVECARAIAHLHSSCSSPIYHRDIKSSNILLDEKYKAKISDFGTSKTISIDKTHVTTCVQGTFGYLDPEFFRSSQFSEKTDVYSFGVVLLELLTSKKPIFTNTYGEPKGLATEFVQLMETSPDELNGMLDSQVLQNCPEKEIEAFAKLIESCLSLNGKQRPTMTEVAMTLEMIKSKYGTEANYVNDPEITRQEGYVLNDEVDITNEDSSIDTSSYNDCSYSMDLQPVI